MAIEAVRAYLTALGREGEILEFPVSSATVELAAKAVGTIPARIAKTLSFVWGERPPHRRGGGRQGGQPPL